MREARFKKRDTAAKAPARRQTQQAVRRSPFAVRARRDLFFVVE
jgi:hypothetical protein